MTLCLTVGDSFATYLVVCCHQKLLSIVLWWSGFFLFADNQSLVCCFIGRVWSKVKSITFLLPCMLSTHSTTLTLHELFLTSLFQQHLIFHNSLITATSFCLVFSCFNPQPAVVRLVI